MCHALRKVFQIHTASLEPPGPSHTGIPRSPRYRGSTGFQGKSFLYFRQISPSGFIMIAVLYGFFVGSGLRFIIEKTPHGKTHVTSLALISFDYILKKCQHIFYKHLFTIYQKPVSLNTINSLADSSSRFCVIRSIAEPSSATFISSSQG